LLLLNSEKSSSCDGCPIDHTIVDLQRDKEILKSKIDANIVGFVQISALFGCELPTNESTNIIGPYTYEVAVIRIDYSTLTTP